MSEELTIQGALEETTVADLCRSLLHGGDTAILTIETPERHDSIYFIGGRMVFAHSSDPDLGLAEVLLRSGELSLDQYAAATDSVTAPNRIGSVLVELKYLRVEELMRALENQVREIVESALALRHGAYTIEFAGELSREIPSLQIPTERLLMDGIRRIASWSLVSRGIGSTSRVLRKSESGSVKSYNLDFSEEESYIYDLLAEPQSIASILHRSYLSDFATCRTLWGLLAAGLVEDEQAEETAGRRTAAVDAMMIESKVEEYNGVFQTIFGLVFQKIGDHTFDFVDRVATHLSPGMLPYVSGINLLNEGRIDFDQLQNNLIASGSAEQTRLVDALLDEILTGWIHEIRSEFGTEFDAPLTQAIEKLEGKRTPNP